MSFTVQEDVGLIVAAAGESRRFGVCNKLLQYLDGVPVFLHSLLEFSQVIPIENVVLVVSARDRHHFERVIQDSVESSPVSNVRIVIGGTTRQSSVHLGLNALPRKAKILAVQDAARPFTKVQLLLSCIESARQKGSGVAARRVTDTIKIASSNGCVESTPDRNKLWAAETPQVFLRSLLEEAFSFVKKNKLKITDEAQALELSKKPVFLVEHCTHNAKITFPADLPM